MSLRWRLPVPSGWLYSDIRHRCRTRQHVRKEQHQLREASRFAENFSAMGDGLCVRADEVRLAHDDCSIMSAGITIIQFSHRPSASAESSLRAQHVPCISGAAIELAAMSEGFWSGHRRHIQEESFARSKTGRESRVGGSCLRYPRAPIVTSSGLKVSSWREGDSSARTV